MFSLHASIGTCMQQDSTILSTHAHIMCLLVHQIHRTCANIDSRSTSIGTILCGNRPWRLPHMVLELLLSMQIHAPSIASKCVEVIQSVLLLLAINTSTPTCTPTAQVEILEAGCGKHQMQCATQQDFLIISRYTVLVEEFKNCGIQLHAICMTRYTTSI